MKIKLEAEDLDAIASAVAAKIGGKAPPKSAKAKAEAEDTETETAEAEAEADFEGAEGAEAEAGVDRDDVLAKLKAVSKKINQADAMAILKKVGGVAKLSLLDEDKFGAVIAACDKALKAKK